MAKILEKLTGKKICVGYDIGCVFEGTVSSSSLGDKFKESGSRFCVPAFHGYSHSYKCQTAYHPNCISGLGLEDLETLERIFSGSNQLAPIIRYASPFRRLSHIHLYFTQMDHEKYGNIGMMLFNNYKQHLSIIATEPALDATLKEQALTRADLTAFEAEERNFFATLQNEDPENIHAIAYVEALKELAKYRYVCSHHVARDTKVYTRRQAPTRRRGSALRGLRPTGTGG